MAMDPAYVGLLVRLFDDLACNLPEYSQKEADRDKEYLLSRVACEGISFVTKILPSLGKHLEGALREGYFTPFPALKRKGRTVTPSFMGPLFKYIFETDGTLKPLDKATGRAERVRAVRQVCYFLYKLRLPYDKEAEHDAINKFCQIDQDLPDTYSDKRSMRILRVASFLLGRIFHDLDPRDVRPRPGPGASASGTPAHMRFEPKVLYDCLHQVYPYYSYYYVGVPHLIDRVAAYKALPRERDAHSVVRMVPKDSRGPRIIAMEQQEYMHLQQGLGEAIREKLMSHPLSRGRVNFVDQTVNGRLALASSITGEYCTLDMNEASDRISRELVSQLFARLPQLRRSLLALSTVRSELPSGDIVATKKFAPMGSSLCFPVMSAVHFALAVSAIHIATGQSTRSIARHVYVYGDDILVKSEYAEVLFDTFPLFGLKFNQGKSFWKGPFRESCGQDALDGECVTPQRLQCLFLDNTGSTHEERREIVPNLVSSLAINHRLRVGGYVRTAEMLRTLLSSRYGELPTVLRGTAAIGFMVDDPQDVDLTRLRKRWNRGLQTYEYRVYLVENAPFVSLMGSWERLLKSQIHVTFGSSADASGRRSLQLLKRRWQPECALHGPSKPSISVPG